jgi:tetratricopeptide (TPR) repeat protein
MFRRLLAAFRVHQNATPAALDDAVPAYDARGRYVLVPRDEWRDGVLHPQLKRDWNAPDALYGTILTALADGFAPELLTAAARLVEIDTHPERSHAAHGAVLLESGRPDDAEAVLLAGIGKAGETAALLTHLARARHDRGDDAGACGLLRRALEIDPNDERALGGWLALARARAGEAGYLDALREACDWPGSWRARLLLARHHLDTGDLAAARAQYAVVLASSDVDGTVLLTMATDLRSHGHAGLAVTLAGPVYEPARHGPQAGLNLLRACLETERAADGEALLTRMRPLATEPFTRHLDEFHQAFVRMRRGRTQTA